MHRSNLIRLLLGVLFILLLALAWLWHQNVSPRLQVWASWITFTFGCAAGCIARSTPSAAVIADSMRATPSGATHLVFKPDDSRPYLISSLPPEKLIGCGVVSIAVLMGRLLT